MINTVRASGQDSICETKGSETRMAPATKSIWSITGNKPPGGIPSLLFTNAPHRSPSKAPREETKPKKRGYPSTTVIANPASVPTSNPEKKPRRVLWLPKIGLPSIKLFPKSMGLPPPTMTGIAFAQYAGKMNFTASRISSDRSIFATHQRIEKSCIPFLSILSCHIDELSFSGLFSRTA